MGFLTISAAYMAAHLLVYCAVFRRTALAKGERAIFLYHAMSFGLAGVAGIVYGWLASDRNCWLGAAAAVSLHGIYSMSFLELWSLAEGGYSLSILESVARGELQPETLAAIGERKRLGRLKALAGLACIRVREERYELTPRGRVLAGLYHTLVVLAKLESIG